MRRIIRSIFKSVIYNREAISALGADFFEYRLRYLRRAAREQEGLKKFSITLFYLTGFVVLIYLIRLGYSIPWTGFTEINPKSGSIVEYKTLWNWLDILLIPLILSFIVYLFNRSQRASELRISLTNNRAAALQDYLDRMTDLMLSGKLNSRAKKSETKIIARARTLTVLDDLSPEQKGYVLRFLKEANLIDKPKPVIDIRGVNLTGVDLFPARLDQMSISSVNFDRAKLARADFYDSSLSGASFEYADLEKANFKKADLNYSYFAYSDLFEADLSDAALIKANFFNANLRRAMLLNAILRSANFENADLRKANLTGAYLQSAKLIDTDLAGAILAGADLSRATLWGANLKGADLTGADLTDAYITWKQLRTARSIKGIKISRPTKL